jgi:hypothetical protein
MSNFYIFYTGVGCGKLLIAAIRTLTAWYAPIIKPLRDRQKLYFCKKNLKNQKNVITYIEYPG